MIKKLEIQEIERSTGSEYTITERVPATSEQMHDKINELVDTVNDIIDWIKRTDETIVKYGIKPIENATISKMENVDPYAEQRKWIGKLCRCWDSDINDDIWGILQDIKDNKTEKYYLYGIGYEHCEPVKPDDDIIYKGGEQ